VFWQENGSCRRTVDYGIAIRPLNLYFSECGDTGVVYPCGEFYTVALIDVLGHGAEARAVAQTAEDYLAGHRADDPSALINGLHDCLTGSRGAVGACCRLYPETGALECAGIGNISVKLVGAKTQSLISRDGILGYGIVHPHPVRAVMGRTDILLLHSDGIQHHFNLLELQAMASKTAEEIAGDILKEYGTKMDDASCIAVKY
jgi:hypothetical protein